MLIAGPLVAIPLAILWLVSGGRWIGLGDAKLMLPLGWYFGVGKGLSIFVFSFWIGAIPSIILLCLPRKRFTMKTELPFAPFIILAALVVYVSGVDILNWTF
jgi:prepilin signal peptidase PulO-like enzyme (type II secretory pathway)